MLIFLGALPPPVHGMSVVNKKMLELLKGGQVKAFNLVPVWAARFFPGKLFTVFKVLHLVLIFLPYLAVAVYYGRRAVVYFSIAGGKGKLLDLPFMWVAGLTASRIFIHHHSFAYCNHHDPAFEKLVRAGRGKITHITLGESMREKLVEMYAIGKNDTEVLSNVAFFQESPESVLRTHITTIGYLSNISFEKGIRDFVETVRLLRQFYPEIQACIAGPCMDNEVRQYILSSCNEIPGMQYLGPVYGKAKSDFFTRIDVLLFPTHYANEAEPLVIHEAFSNGVPVIASGRGCIPDIINQGGGISLPLNIDFANAAASALERWLINNNEYCNNLILLRQRYPVYKHAMQTRLCDLLKKLG